MSVLASVFGGNWLSLSNPALWSAHSTGPLPTRSGESVSPETAMTLSVYFACLRNLAEDLGKLPLISYRRLQPRGKERLTDHPAHRLLNLSANDEMSALSVRETLTHFAAGWGNGYAEIERDAAGRPVALWPIHPSRVDVVREPGRRLYYRVRSDPQRTGRIDAVTMRIEDMLHVHGLGWDGVTGYSVARIGAESIGHAMAVQTFGAAYFGNGAHGTVVIVSPEVLDEDAYKRMRQSWMEVYGGPHNSHKPIILEEGVKLEKLSIPPEEAQFIQTKQFDVEDVCRWFRMPPHKVQHLLRSTNNNIEHQSLEYVGDTLMPWARRWESEVNRKLYLMDEQADMFSEHLFAALLRGDQRTRAEFYGKMFQVGSLSPNDIRELENMNPIDGGDKYYVQVNMRGVDDPLPQPASAGRPAAPKPSSPDQRQDRTVMYKRTHAAIIADTLARLLTKESKAAGRAFGKHAMPDRSGFDQWREKFYADHEPGIFHELRSPCVSLAQLIGGLTPEAVDCAETVLRCYVEQHVSQSIADLNGAYGSPQAASVCDRWLVDRAANAAVVLTDRVAAAVHSVKENNHAE